MTKSRATALVLNWNTLAITKKSVQYLVREVPTLLVDNGSNDGSADYFTGLTHNRLATVILGANKGQSVARNRAIDLVKTPYFFLLDGDILYVPGSIAMLEKIIDKHPECGCVGVHTGETNDRYGQGGVPWEEDADRECPDSPPVFTSWPMAWTQYGLFRKTDQRFTETPPFNEPGHGLEDDWYFWEMQERGLKSYFTTRPIYFHQAHSGKRELALAGLSDKFGERLAVFKRRFGEKKWTHKPANAYAERVA